MMNLISYEGPSLPAMTRAEARQILSNVPFMCDSEWDGGKIVIGRDLALRIWRGRAWPEMRGGRNGWERTVVDEANPAHRIFAAIVAVWNELGLNTL